MRLLTQAHDPQTAAEISSRLYAAGIPTITQSAGFARATATTAIFVCINAQFDDAVALLDDPDHEVREPVDVAAFQSDVRGLDGGLLGWGLALLAGVVAIVALVVLITNVRAKQDVAVVAAAPPSMEPQWSGSDCPANLDPTGDFIGRYLAVAHPITTAQWAGQTFRHCRITGTFPRGGQTWWFDVNASGAAALHRDGDAEMAYYACDAACDSVLGAGN